MTLIENRLDLLYYDSVSDEVLDKLIGHPLNEGCHLHRNHLYVFYGCVHVYQLSEEQRVRIEALGDLNWTQWPARRLS